MKLPSVVSLLGAAAAASAAADKPTGPSLNLTTAESGNPIFDGWFADPEIRVYDDVFWLFATTSVAFKDQKHFDAWSSTDLVQWTKHPKILTAGTIPWVKDTMWAPTSTKGPDGKYYLYFSSHTGVRSKQQPNNGLAVAVADKPEGPYRDALNGSRLLDEAVHGGNPMDPDVFTDDDGQKYLYFGGEEANVGILNSDMTSFRAINESAAGWTDSKYFKSITPEPSNYEEGTKVFKRNGTYYMMWSENGYADVRYQVAYGTSNSPLGPFSPRGVILKQDPAIAVATGHNSVLNIPGTDIWYIVYHRRPLHESDVDNRVVSLDRMYFDEDGNIEPIELLVKDNFDDGRFSQVLWQKKSGVWVTVADGKQQKQKQLRGLAMEAEALVLMDSHFADLVYDADIALEDDGTEAGVTFRTAPSRNRKKPAAFNGYAVWLSADTGEVLLGHQKGKRGKMRVLESSSDLHVKSETRYHLRVEFKGTQVSVFVDDMAVPIITVENDKDTSGQNGLWVKSGSALFDNVSIRHP